MSSRRRMVLVMGRSLTEELATKRTVDRVVKTTDTICWRGPNMRGDLRTFQVVVADHRCSEVSDTVHRFVMNNNRPPGMTEAYRTPWTSTAISYHHGERKCEWFGMVGSPIHMHCAGNMPNEREIKLTVPGPPTSLWTGNGARGHGLHMVAISLSVVWVLSQWLY